MVMLALYLQKLRYHTATLWKNCFLQRLVVIAPFPAVAEAPAVVDGTLMVMLAGLGVAAGISVGLLYRHMHSQEEGLRLRLQNMDAEFRALMTMTDDAVLVLSHDGLVRSTNPAAEEYFGMGADELIGESLQKFIEQPLSLAGLTRHGPANFQSRALRLDGQKSEVDVLLSPIQLVHEQCYFMSLREKAAPPSTTANSTDISLPTAKACHDINNQLTGIIGNLSLILMAAQTDAATHERVVNAKKTALKAQDIVCRLQALAKGETKECENTPQPAATTIVPMPSLVVPAVSPAAKSAARILVLDDEEAICALVAAALGDLGYEVLEAQNADTAFRHFEEGISTGRRIQLIISDLSLEGQFSGQEVVARMKKLDPQLRAIVSSGHNTSACLTHYRDHGFDAAIAKPYEITKLGETVCATLDINNPARRYA